MKRTVVFDFDGVIHKYSKGWQDGTIYDEPVEGIKEVIDELRKTYSVVIVSTRCTTPACREEMIRWLKYYNIEVDELTNIKVPAMVYVDDRGLTFDPRNIKTLVKDIKHFETWQNKPDKVQNKLF